MCVVIEDDSEFTLVTHLGPLGVKWVLCRIWTSSCECSMKGIILDYLMWSIRYKAFMPRQGLTCPETCRVASSGKMCCCDGECEKVLLSVIKTIDRVSQPKTETTHPKHACTSTCMLQLNWNSSTLHSRQSAISPHDCIPQPFNIRVPVQKRNLSRQKSGCNIDNSEDSGWVSMAPKHHSNYSCEQFK